MIVVRSRFAGLVCVYLFDDMHCLISLAHIVWCVGAIILGMEEKRPNWDKIGANMNNVRTKKLIKDADVVVVKFGEKYRQWNAVCIFLVCYVFLHSFRHR